MKDEKEKRNVYIKIMYRKLLLVPYTLGNTVTILEGMLNIGNLMLVGFCGFSEIFLKHKEGNDI
jgi:hypothetical protein